MSRTVRKLFAKALTGAACLLPLALETRAQAQPGTATPPAAGSPAGAPGGGAARPLTSKELHQHLARGSGWIRIFEGNGAHHGTGWILDRGRRLMVTNNHVVAGKDEVFVTFPIWTNGKLVTAEAAYQTAPKLKAAVIDRDPNRDLALIQVESIPDGMHELKLAANEPDAGDEVRLIGGFTNGGDGLVWGAVTGVVRACGPQDLDPDKVRRRVPVREVLSDARSNGGNSGAPVVNAAGEVVAVHFAWKPWANGVARHVSVTELKAYLKEATPLVEPGSADQFLVRAQRRFAVGRNDAAIADASRALAKDPKFAAAMAVRGRAFLAKNDAQTAIGDFTDALELDPGNYDVRIARGRAHRTAGNSPEALGDFGAAIRTDPAKPTAYNERGLTHFFAKDYAKAEADFGRAVDAAPKDPVFWGNRADARGRQNKHEEAAADWATAADLAPWDAYYSNQLGFALRKLGKNDAAVDAFARAADAGNGAPLYLGNLADTLRIAGKHEAAVKAFTRAIEGWKKLESNGARVSSKSVALDYGGRAASRFALKQYKEAVDDLTKALELTDRTVAEYFVQRAEALEALGESGAAGADREAAEKLGHKVAKPVEGDAKKKADPAPESLAGAWSGSYTVNGVTATEVITLHADGTFDATITLASARGVERVRESGTWSATATRLRLDCKALGTITRPYERVAGGVKIELAEYGIAVTFAKKN